MELGWGIITPDLLRQQYFNWTPRVRRHDCGGESDQDCAVGAVAGVGVGVRAGMGGKDGTTCMLRMRRDDANMRRGEAEKMVSDLGKAVTWVTEGGESERVVGGFKSR